MSQTSKEIVKRCLTFNNPERVPYDMWLLPWAGNRYPDTVAEINRRFPSDFSTTRWLYKPSTVAKGDPYKQGYYTDEWGCVFRNLQDGIIGEVETPILTDISDWKSVKLPYEQLPSGKLETQAAYDAIKRYYDNTDTFVKANINPRPWERYQFIRGTQNALMDVLMPDFGFKDLLKKIHDFYMREVELWSKSAVDAISFMDDWGSQNQLLIPPDMWREYFKPIYREYCAAAKAEGKFVFMHSDGYIQEIYEDLIEVGVDAINSQLFCMDMDVLAEKAKGKITFWGEIDRQWILPDENPQIARDAVRKVADKLYDSAGGTMAQFEFGLGANPQSALAVFEEWEKISKGL